MLSPSNHRSRIRTAAMAAVVPAEAPAATIKRKWSAHAIVAAVITVALLALPTAAAAHDDGFSDVADSNPHSANIDTLDHAGTFEGTLCGAGMFCPWDSLSRAHMAVWLVRVVDGSDPAPVTATRFVDVAGTHPQAAFIERFAALGITEGCETDPLSYCPDEDVSRAQMASFLARAFKLAPAGEPAGFADVAAGGAHSANIDTLAAIEITVGCDTDPLRFCPWDDVSRAQMASFLVRTVEYVRGNADIGVYRDPDVVLDNGWVVYGTGYVPQVHPDTADSSWERGTFRLGYRPDDRPRRSEPVQAWVDWCGEWRGCDPLLFDMVWAIDYLGANPQCVTQHYQWRAHAASQPGVSDGYNNAGLVNRYGWHRCATVIDPIQPDGRLLSDHGLSMAERCRTILPTDVELETDLRYLEPVRDGLDCDEWGAWVESRQLRYSDCDRSARLAEEWLEHFIEMPERYWRISC